MIYKIDSMTNEKSFNHNLILGGISRGFTVTLLYPLDTIKTRTQYSHGKINMLPLYYGYNIAISTQIPYGMIVFGMYENIKSYMLNMFPNASKTNIHISSAVISDLMGSLFLSPCEIIKQNMQIGKYKNFVIAYKNIVYLYGYPGFYKGYSTLVMRDLPFRGIQLPLYEFLKDKYLNNDHNLFKTSLVAAIAGMTAGFMTNPIDVLKTRLMCSNFNQSFAEVVRNTFRTEGIIGLFYGISYRTLYLGLSSSLFFITYEILKKSP